MDNSKNIIKTGFYSDYACKFFNCLKSQTVISCKAINRTVDSIFSNVPSIKSKQQCSGMPYEFKHAPNGEVILESPGTSSGLYPDMSFTIHSNVEHLRNIALQIKLLAHAYLNNKSAWSRENFDDEVTFSNKAFPVAEVYFIYDMLLNHVRSTDVFKRRHIDIAAKIIGVPRDPIVAEVIQNIEDKRRKIMDFYDKEIKEELIDIDAYCRSPSKASIELLSRLEAIICEEKEKNCKKIAEITAKRDAELKELDTYMASFQQQTFLI